jgi:hypothetical protein
VRGFAETIGRLAHGPTRSTFASAISISLAAVGAGRAFCHTPLPAAGTDWDSRPSTNGCRRPAVPEAPTPPRCRAGCSDDATNSLQQNASGVTTPFGVTKLAVL